VILLDTHALLWLALESAKLSARAKAAIREARDSADPLAVSDITLFEVAAAESKKRLRLTTSLETFFSEIESKFVVLPITGAICVRAFTFPADYPGDPADRIIGATALVHGIPLLTADRLIRQSQAIHTIW